MTNKEIITQLEDIKCHCQEMYEAEIKNVDTSSNIWGKDVEALDFAIKALEQQPSEDCISRQVVKEMLTETWTKYMPMELDINLSFVLEKISELPSVIPIRPHGEWIHFTDDFKDYAACSCCGYGEEGEVLLEDKTPFCPVCGADMREGETDAG